MNLNQKQQHAFNRIMQNANVYISGPGGVGKSVIVNKLREQFQNETVFVAPTGIAAINIKGATIHRVFRFPIGFIDKFQAKRVAEKAEAVFGKEAGVKRIVIDEISMVRADLFSAIDMQLRHIRKTNKPFGGLQVIVVGDFHQLTPILKKGREKDEFMKEYHSEFAFDTESWTQANFETIQLDEVMRTTDKDFIDALTSIRKKDRDYAKAVNFLNKRSEQNELEEDTIFLCSTNADADTINQHNYELVEGEPKTYYAERWGQFKDPIVPEALELKVGVKVLICANGEDYVNGQVGYVDNMTNREIFVRLEGYDEGIVCVKKHKWEELDYEPNPSGGVTSVPIGSYTQFPLKLGYAITVHKSQGLSLDKAIIYSGRGFFCAGQAYVGLSRLRSLAGLGMLKPIDLTDIIVDKRVTDFYERNQYANLMNM